MRPKVNAASLCKNGRTTSFSGWFGLGETAHLHVIMFDLVAVHHVIDLSNLSYLLQCDL